MQHFVTATKRRSVSLVGEQEETLRPRSCRATGGSRGEAWLRRERGRQKDKDGSSQIPVGPHPHIRVVLLWLTEGDTWRIREPSSQPTSGQISQDYKSAVKSSDRISCEENFSPVKEQAWRSGLAFVPSGHCYKGDFDTVNTGISLTASSIT